MKLLLDTHVLIWARLSPEKLADAAAEALQDEGNELWYSPISVWEILLLAEKKRLKINGDPYGWVERALDGLQEAPLNRHVAMESRRLHLPDKDPGDRFIAATALVYDLVLVTADRKLLECPKLKSL
ncbi:MAG TPA: type II toxin-antitoxin system VapC family toxin [Polyangia bacterium]|nr:type II toxin-antitoxin system VapC family toxin [Polyangia bacterium]